jgi:hypothetical protein
MTYKGRTRLHKSEYSTLSSLSNVSKPDDHRKIRTMIQSELLYVLAVISSDKIITSQHVSEALTLPGLALFGILIPTRNKGFCGQWVETRVERPPLGTVRYPVSNGNDEIRLQ